MRFPNEIWSLILNINYEAFCIKCAHQLPWNDSESYKRNSPYMRDSILGHLLLGHDVNEVIHNRRLFLEDGWGRGCTTLFIACKYQPSAVGILIDNGADVNFNSIYSSPIFIACSFQPSIVQLLIDKGANVNQQGGKGNITPLMLSCVIQPSLVGLFINAGAEVNACNIDGITPLWVSCWKKNK